MVAHVLVMDTPFFTKPDAQGRFRSSNVPSGAGELFVWHERSQLWRQALPAGADAEVKVALELSRPACAAASEQGRATVPEDPPR